MFGDATRPSANVKPMLPAPIINTFINSILLNYLCGKTKLFFSLLAKKRFKKYSAFGCENIATKTVWV